MAKKTSKSKIAFFHKYSWFHRIKEVLPDGKTKYGKIGGFKAPEEAEESYFKHLEIFESNRRKMFNKVINKEILLTEYLKYWIEDVYKHKVETTTARITAYVIYKLVIPNIVYDIKLKLVTEDYLNELLRKIEPITKSAANESRKILYLAFKDAMLDDYITYNPVTNTKKYRQEKNKIIVLTPEELSKFLNIVSTGNWYLEILLGLYAGLRKGEILGLKFSDFDLKEKTVTIQRQLASEYKIKKESFNVESHQKVERNPKTSNSIRTILLPDIIINEVKRRKSEIQVIKEFNKDYNDNDYVSAQDNGNSRSFSALNLYINRVCKRNGIRKITVHGLRHMFATILIENGVPIAKISAILGHASIHTTFDFYLDVMDEKNKISAFMNNVYNMEGMVSNNE